MSVSREFFETQVLGLLGALEGAARRLTRNDADAEDLVAETVSRAWRALDTLECEAAFRAWMFRILNNTFVSGLRRAGARPQTESFDAAGGEAEEQEFSLFKQMHQPFLLWFSNPEQEFLDKLLREDLERALARLPEQNRMVVMLSDVEEFSYAEIAQALAIPVGTVRSRLARARGALQKMLWQQAGERGLSRAHAGLCRTTRQRRYRMKKNELNCEQALRQLFAYLDRELAQHDHAAMEEHLKVCKACFSRMEFERLLKGKVKDLREERASPGVRERIKALLRGF